MSSSTRAVVAGHPTRPGGEEIREHHLGALFVHGIGD